jgi:uncharacterized protein YvpB
MKTRTQLNKQKKTKKYLLIGALVLLILGVVFYKKTNEFFDNEVLFNFIPNEKVLSAPEIHQNPELPNGCEVTSLAMLLNYEGYHVTKGQLASQVKHVSSFPGHGFRGNPNVGFVGYMGIANAGWCVFHGPLTDLAKKYDAQAVDYTGSSFKQVLIQVSRGKPVVVWTSLNFKPVNDMQTWKTRQGKVHVTPSSHCVLVTGYNKQKQLVYINDPLGGKNDAVPMQPFEQVYNQQGQQAVFINK